MDGTIKRPQVGGLAAFFDFVLCLDSRQNHLRLNSRSAGSGRWHRGGAGDGACLATGLFLQFLGGVARKK